MLKLILTLVAALSVAASVGCNPSCSNPYLNHLKTQSVEVFSTPRAPLKPACSSDWETHGTCCDVDSLIEYANRDKHQILTALQRLKESYFKITKAMLPIFQFGSQSDSPQQPKPATSLAGIFVEKFKQLTQTDSNLSSAQMKYYPLIQNVSASSHFNQTSDACWATMIKYRSSSLCPTCSGDTTQHFFKDKGVITYEVCQTVLDMCGFSNNKLFYVIRALQESKEVISHMLKLRLFTNTQTALEVNSLLHLLNFNSMLDARHILGSYMLLDMEQRKVVANGAHVCDMMITLSNTPFIVELANILARSESTLLLVLQHLAGSIPASSAAPASSTSNWPKTPATPAKRRLAAVGPEVEVWTGDTFTAVLQEDPGFPFKHSYYVSNVDTSQLTHIDAIPMKLDRLFP